MALQLVVGFLISGTNIVMHAVATVAAISLARSIGLRHTSRRVMVAVVLVLKFTHMLEIFVWSRWSSQR